MTAARGRRRGPAPAISRDDIVDAALALGLAGVTMREVAERLGVSIQGLYHYVPTRDDLLRAAAARLISRVTLPPPGDLDWPQWLRAVAGLVRAELGNHPGVASVSLTNPVRGGGNVELLEQGVSVLVERYALPPVFATKVVLGLAVTVFGLVAQSETAAGARTASGPEEAGVGLDELFDFAVDAYLTGARALLTPASDPAGA